MFKVFIGLEIHMQLLTKRKAFSLAPNNFGEEQNTMVHAIDLGYPGTLPLIEKEFILLGLQVGHLLNMKFTNVLEFDRKHYLYPDLPKGFQITQFFNPLAKNGKITLNNNKVIRIMDIHLEEDTAKRIYQKERVLVDYNRCGIPLLEIVTDKDFSKASEVIEFIDWLRIETINANITNGILAHGSLRCDVNLSVKNLETNEHTERAEIKNLNSYKAIEDAINYETRLHKEALKEKTKIKAQTKTFDENTRQTRLMRIKTTINQYFYVPEPNLLKIKIDDELINEAKSLLPLSIKKIQIEMNKMGINNEVIKAICSNRILLNLYKDVYEETKSKENIVKIANLISNNIRQKINLNSKMLNQIKGKELLFLLEDLNNNKISSKKIDNILLEWLNFGNMNRALEKFKLKSSLTEEELSSIINKVVDENQVFINNNIKTRKEKVEKMLMGKVMKLTKGNAHPQKAMSLIKKLLTQKND